MNRLIKFRVWDKEDEAFQYWGFFKDDAGDYFKHPPTVSTGMGTCKENSDQFTGLVLEDETEVWENDIVQAFRYTDAGPVQMIAVVEWSDLTKAWVFDALEYGFGAMISDDNWGDIEVIGNSHQNPDLLP